MNVNYSSPGSVHPAQDVHDFVIYLPKEYGTVQGKQYPLMYLSHGGGSDDQDWENLAALSNIMDQLILAGHIPPTVVVMPSFYNIAPEYKQIYGDASQRWQAPSAQVVRENYMSYLFPYVQANFAVSSDSAMRGFLGPFSHTKCSSMRQITLTITACSAEYWALLQRRTRT